MEGRTTGRRGVAILAIAILAAGALAASSAGAAAPLTKKKVKKIATKVFNSKIGSASVANAAAVNGILIDRFFFQAPANTTDAVIGTFGPVTLKATCDGSGEPTLRASWNETINRLTFNGASASQSGDGQVDANQTISIGSGQFGSVGLTEAIGFTSNIHTSIEYFLRDSPAIGETSCFFSGYVKVG
ncbi:MAG: hypothetical protein ACRDHH_05510 [Actinomycetota bacterium]